MFSLEAKRLKIRPETHFLAIFGQKSFYTVTWLLTSEHTRDLILGPNSRFLGMANHLRPLSRASDLSEGQEWGGGDVRGH